MKPKKSSWTRSSAVGLMPHFRPFHLPCVLTLALWQLSSHEAHAVAHYWDNNDTTAGFGSGAGTTWGTSVLWSTSLGGTITPTVTLLTTSDQANFGTDANGLGGGTITVSGTVNASSIRFGNSTTGNVVLSGGTINLADTTTIHVGAGGTTVHTITSQITGAATSLNKTGNTLRLDANNSYTGQTIISSGTLILNNVTVLGGNNPGTNGTSSISMGANSTLQSNFAPADGGIADSYVYAPITLSAAGTNNFFIGNGSSTAPAESVRFNINGAIGGSFGANVVFGNTTASRNNADSIIVLGAASTYNGNTMIQAGSANNKITVQAGVENALPTTTVLSFDTVVGSGSGRFTTFDLNGNNQTLAGLGNGGIVPEVRNIVVTSATAATLTINNADPFTFGGRTISTTVGTIGTNTRAQISGAISLIKDGAGTFTLGGTLAGGAVAAGNAFTGTTKVLEGILVLGETLSIQNSAFDTAGSIAGDADNGLRTTVPTLRLGGLTGNKDFADVFTDTTGGYGGLTALTLNPGTGVTNSYAGDIGNGAGAMTLTKTGLGTQVLTGANTHSATTIANGGGTLRITTAAALGAGAVTISTAGTSTGTLELALTGTNTINNTFSGFSSAFTLTNATPGVAQILNTSGTNKITSDLTITGTGGNGLNVVSDGGLVELSGTITTSVAAGFRVLSVGGSGDGLVSGAITNGTGLSVTKSGSGTWTLAGVSTYLGNTTVVGGTLDLTSTGGLTFAIGLSGINNKITGTTSGNVNLDGSFTFDLTAAGTDPADFWNIVDLANLSGTSGFTDNFNVVDFTDNGGGIWSKDNGGTVYQFSQGTGLLTVIPEPSAALLGALGALLLLRRRR